jgi:hypothetical protein
MGQVSAFIAISSSIRHIGTQLAEAARRLTADNKVLFAFDLGHQQYGGRYVMTLKSIHRKMHHVFGSAIVILAYWKHLNGNTKSSWIFSDSAVTITCERVPIQTSLQLVPVIDYVDVVEVTKGSDNLQDDN